MLPHEAQRTDLIGQEMCVCVCDSLIRANRLGGWKRKKKKTRSRKLNVCHSTFGVCFQKDLDVGGGHVSLLVLVPPHPRPAVSFVLLDDVQQLALRHGDGALVVT